MIVAAKPPAGYYDRLAVRPSSQHYSAATAAVGQTKPF
jgi:hypothetical protein